MKNSSSFATFLIDPPWPERGGGRIKRGADRHYPVLSVGRMPEVITKTCPLWRPATNAHMYLWATNNHLVKAAALIKLLGFRYITAITWVKPHFGLGQYFRGQTEHLLFAVRGKGLQVARKRTRSFPTVIHAPHVRGVTGKTVHSGKPVQFYELIEAASRGPHAEIFARHTRAGWSSWGNEVEVPTGELNTPAGGKGEA